MILVLLLSAEPVTAFGTPQLTRLVEDLWETMKVHSGAVAAPQIGENLQVVVFGTGEPNPRYPDAGIVPPTVLINPIVTPAGRVRGGWAELPVLARPAWCRTALCLRALSGL